MSLSLAKLGLSMAHSKSKAVSTGAQALLLSINGLNLTTISSYDISISLRKIY